MLTHLSLFSGIGGLDLAAEAAGFQTIGQCEWADYPTKILEKHWPEVPRWRDIRTLTGGDFFAKTGYPTCDIISGGFPCQPFSVAGKRRGTSDDRYLWPEMLRVISEIRPTWVLGENVPGIINLALDQVLADLESQGYTCQTFNIPACGVDAPHKRARICIVGYAEHHGLSSATLPGGADEAGYNKPERENPPSKSKRTSKPGYYGTVADADCGQCLAENEKVQSGRHALGDSRGDVADTDEPGLQGRQRGGMQECAGERAAWQSNTPSPKSDAQQRDGRGRARDGWAESANGGRRPAESRLGGMDDGLSNWMDEPAGIPRVATGIEHRVDRLKCLGNAVVPQQFYPFFKFIADIERDKIV